MAELGLTVDMVIEAKTKDYQNSLEPAEGDSEEVKQEKREKKEKFKKDIKEATQDAIQQKIDEAEAIFSSIKTTCTSVISCAETWSVQIPAMATPETTAPKTSAAVLVALTNGVSMAKSNLEEANSEFVKLNGIITGLGIQTPAPITALGGMLSQASSALSKIPI